MELILGTAQLRTIYGIMRERDPSLDLDQALGLLAAALELPPSRPCDPRRWTATRL